jgi:hypothetical protein
LSAYQDAVARRSELEAELRATETTYQRHKQRLTKDLNEVNGILNVAENGVDAELFLTARELLFIDWSRDGNLEHIQHAEIAKAVADAVEELRAGGRKLRTEYIGIKRYDGWLGQRSDHAYGYGPKHGSVWWSVGLTPAGRRPERDLTEEEQLACIAWLRKVYEAPNMLVLAGLQ